MLGIGHGLSDRLLDPLGHSAGALLLAWRSHHIDAADDLYGYRYAHDGDVYAKELLWHGYTSRAGALGQDGLAGTFAHSSNVAVCVDPQRQVMRTMMTPGRPASVLSTPPCGS
jgi:hypothetical protein